MMSYGTSNEVYSFCKTIKRSWRSLQLRLGASPRREAFSTKESLPRTHPNGRYTLPHIEAHQMSLQTHIYTWYKLGSRLRHLLRSTIQHIDHYFQIYMIHDKINGE